MQPGGGRGKKKRIDLKWCFFPLLEDNEQLWSSADGCRGDIKEITDLQWSNIFLKKCKLKIFFPIKRHFSEHSGSAAARETCRDLDQPRREIWVNSTPATDWKKKILTLELMLPHQKQVFRFSWGLRNHSTSSLSDVFAAVEKSPPPLLSF